MYCQNEYFNELIYHLTPKYKKENQLTCLFFIVIADNGLEYSTLLSTSLISFSPKKIRKTQHRHFPKQLLNWKY
jgi:hypothetical protein